MISPSPRNALRVQGLILQAPSLPPRRSPRAPQARLLRHNPQPRTTSLPQLPRPRIRVRRRRSLNRLLQLLRRRRFLPRNRPRRRSDKIPQPTPRRSLLARPRAPAVAVLCRRGAVDLLLLPGLVVERLLAELFRPVQVVVVALVAAGVEGGLVLLLGGRVVAEAAIDTGVEGAAESFADALGGS